MSAEAIGVIGLPGAATGGAIAPGGRAPRGAGRFGRHLAEQQAAARVAPLPRRGDTAGEPTAASDAGADPARTAADAGGAPMTDPPGERLPEPIAANLPAPAGTDMAVGDGNRPRLGAGGAGVAARAPAAAADPDAGAPTPVNAEAGPGQVAPAPGREAVTPRIGSEGPAPAPTLRMAVRGGGGSASAPPAGIEPAAEPGAPAQAAGPAAGRERPGGARSAGPPIGSAAGEARIGLREAGRAVALDPARAPTASSVEAERPADLAIRLDPGGRLLSLGVRDAVLAGRLIATSDQLRGELAAVGAEVDAIDVAILPEASAGGNHGEGLPGLAEVSGDAGGAADRSGPGRMGPDSTSADLRGAASGPGPDGAERFASGGGEGLAAAAGEGGGRQAGDAADDGRDGVDRGTGDGGFDSDPSGGGGSTGGDRRSAGVPVAALMLQLPRAAGEAAAPATARAGVPAARDAGGRRVDIHV